jgi:hypothetical protein
MIDNVTLAIENLVVKLKTDQIAPSTSPYKDAFMLFMKEQQIYDPEDILEVIDPILIAKIKQEYINTNNFSKDSQYAKQSSLFD